MNIFGFGSEEDCRNHFEDQKGIKCSKCGHTEYYWIKSCWSYECKKCRNGTAVYI